jgi:hypothetical protein
MSEPAGARTDARPTRSTSATPVGSRNTDGGEGE